MFNQTRWFLAVLALVAVSQAARAGDNPYPPRMEAYEARAGRYVADRTQAVAPRTRYVQPRTVYVNDSSRHARVVYPDTSRVGVVRNPSYHSQAVVHVVADDDYDDRAEVIEGDDVQDDYVAVNRTSANPSQYAGYSQFSGYGSYHSYPAYHHPPTYPVYRHYPAYHSYPAYHGGHYYHHGYPYPAYRGHGYGGHHGGYYGGHYGGHHGGHYGHHRGHGSHWGVSVHFRF